MSTIRRKFPIYLAFCVLFSLFGLTIFARQTFESRIKLDAKRQSLAVEGKFSPGAEAAQSKNWSFINSAAGAENIAERIADFKLFDERGVEISVKKFAAGEFLAEGRAVAWSYTSEIGKSQSINALAHVSWIDDKQGILMLDDIFPQFSPDGNQPASGRVEFDLPAGWKIISSEKRVADNVFEVENVEKAVFLIGEDWRGREIAIGDDGKLNLAVSGEWRFSDDEAREIAAEIFAEYRNLFGELPTKRAQIALAHFPPDVKFGRWQAETRGANLTVVSSDMPFKAQALQRFHEQLRHELFHLWMPNNLALTGNYAWFYEGFTVYQALKTGVKTNRIRFEDFLDTLAQAYNLDNFQTRRMSLLDESKNGAAGAAANPQVYARGMIVAFLCDAALLRTSRGKRSITNVFREIYSRHRKPNAAREANRAILDVLGEYKELSPTVEKYVKGIEKIDWKTDLSDAGIEQIEENGAVRLRVKAKPSGRQKDLLDDLGYNNWRKISAKTK